MEREGSNHKDRQGMDGFPNVGKRVEVLDQNPNMRVFNISVKYVLLTGAEPRRLHKTTLRGILALCKQCLRKQ